MIFPLFSLAAPMIPKPTRATQQRMNFTSAFVKEEPMESFISNSGISSTLGLSEATDEEFFELGDIGLDANFSDDFSGKRLKRTHNCFSCPKLYGSLIGFLSKRLKIIKKYII